MRNRFRKKGWYNNAVAILIGVIGYVALTHFGTINEWASTFMGYLKPIILGCVIAYIVNPLASVLNRKVLNGIKRDSLRWGLSVALGMITVILLLSLLLLALIPQLVESIGLLLRNMDGYIASMQKLLQDMDINIGGIDIGNPLEEFMTSSEDLIKTGSQLLSSSLKGVLNTSKDLGKNIVSWGLALVLSFYLLSAVFRETMHFLGKCNDILIRYIVFSILDAVIVGGATAVFMAIARMDYIGLIAVVCGVTNLIPSFGTIIGGAIGGFILLLVNPLHALMFLAFTAVLQTLDGYVIKPKLFGDSLGVSGLLILVAIIVFGNAFGIVGILLAIPLAAILDFVYEEAVLPQLERRRARLDAEEAALAETEPQEKGLLDEL